MQENDNSRIMKILLINNTVTTLVITEMANKEKWQ